MPVDTRRTTTCTIAGNAVTLTAAGYQIADDSLQGSGLIKCRGSMTVSGAITPAVGAVVVFTETGPAGSYTVPRRMRVLSSFADPLKRETTVELGCLLTYLSDRKPPLQKDGTRKPIRSKEEHGAKECYAYDLATLSLTAEYIRAELVSRLGLTYSGPALTNSFSVDDFDVSGGYVAALSDLLVSESLVGYLNASDVLTVRSLASGVETGPLLTAPGTIVDIGPIGSGELPGEAVAVPFTYRKLKPAASLTGVTNDELLSRNWESQATFNGLQDVFITFEQTDGTVGTQLYKVPEYATSRTDYDAWDRVIRQINVSASSLPVANGAYVSDALGIGVNPGTFAADNRTEKIITYKSGTTASVLGDTGPASGCITDPPENADEIDLEITYEYAPQASVAGSIGFSSYVLPDGSLIPIDGSLVLVGVTTTSYEVNQAAGITRTFTTSKVSRIRTPRGQQSVAKEAQLVTTATQAADLINYGTDLVLDKTSTQIALSKDFGVQRRPSQSERNNEANQRPDIEDEISEVVFTYGAAESQSTIEFSMPYVPDDKISWTLAGGYVSTASDAPQKAQTFGQVQNALLVGNRNGMSIQTTPEGLPSFPFDPFYVQINGFTVLYRVNGRSWGCQGMDALGSCDGLLYGAVGAGAGVSPSTSWVPLPPGLSSLPTPPAPSGGNITPTVLFPPFNVTVPLAMGVLAGLEGQPISWDITPQSQDSTAGVTAGMVGTPALVLDAEAGAFTLAGQDVDFRRPITLFADAGAFILTGQDAALRPAAIVLVAEAGSFILAGQDAALRPGLNILTAETGEFILTGQSSELGLVGVVNDPFELLALSSDLLSLRLT